MHRHTHTHTHIQTLEACVCLSCNLSFRSPKNDVTECQSETMEENQLDILTRMCVCECVCYLNSVCYLFTSPVPQFSTNCEKLPDRILSAVNMIIDCITLPCRYFLQGRRDVAAAQHTHNSYYAKFLTAPWTINTVLQPSTNWPGL